MTDEPPPEKADPSGLQRISSSALPRGEAVTILRELYAREFMRVDLISTAKDWSFDYDVVIKAFDNVTWANSNATPVTVVREGALLSDGDDDIYLATSTNGATIRLKDKDLEVAPNDYFMVSKARAHRLIDHGGAESRVVQVKHAELAKLLPGLEEAPVHTFSRNTPGIDLLFGYAAAAVRSDTSAPELATLTSRQLKELFSAVLGAAPELTLATRQTAVLHAIKTSALSRLDDPNLRLYDLAAVHRVSPRYIQKLFEESGVSYSDFIRQERLDRARQRLRTDQRSTILQIALDSGFGDLTTFNRAFRRAFDQTPSDARAEAKQARLG